MFLISNLLIFVNTLQASLSHLEMGQTKTYKC